MQHEQITECFMLVLPGQHFQPTAEAAFSSGLTGSFEFSNKNEF